MESISAEDLQKGCPKLLDRIPSSGLAITKGGVIVARIYPMVDETSSGSVAKRRSRKGDAAGQSAEDEHADAGQTD